MCGCRYGVRRQGRSKSSRLVRTKLHLSARNSSCQVFTSQFVWLTSTRHDISYCPSTASHRIAAYVHPLPPPRTNTPPPPIATKIFDRSTRLIARPRHSRPLLLREWRTLPRLHQPRPELTIRRPIPILRVNNRPTGECTRGNREGRGRQDSLEATWVYVYYAQADDDEDED